MTVYQTIKNVGKQVLVVGGLVGILAGCIDSRHEELKRQLELSERFNTVYNSALVKYADKDKDGFVTTSEKDAFDKDLLRDKSVTLVVGNMPRYLDGTEVSTETVINWIKNYRPSE